MENKISQRKIQVFINKCKELIKVCGLINNDPDLFLDPNKEKITNVSIIRPLHDIQPFRYSNQKIKSNQLYLRIKTNKTKEYDYLLYIPYKYKYNGKLYETFKNLRVSDYDGYWFGNNYEVLVDNVDIEIDKYIFMTENVENDPDHYITYTKYMDNNEYKDWYNKTHHITPEYIEFQKREYEYWKNVYYNDMEKYKDLDSFYLKNMTLEEFLDDHCDLDVINNN